MTFSELNLIDPILKALDSQGYTEPTPIQAQTIPLILEKRDILGCAQTGTGKTAAFAIPIIQLMNANKKPHDDIRRIKALVLTPTRELAIQIGDSFSDYGKNTRLKNVVIFGGVKQNAQVTAINKGIDILIATPGRLLDLISQKLVDLSALQFFVLDEADRMLDMGFVQDVKKILTKIPTKRQSLFFSATMPKEIVKLADSILDNPAKVEVAPASSTAETISQTVYHVDKSNKRHLLIEVLKDKNIERGLVFTRTKHGADKVTKDLNLAGINALAIHGNKSQNNRQNALNSFKENKIRILVATDIAARGIDIDELTHVINYELPNIPEQYVHRIGRTGRAGLSGVAIAFADADEMEYLRDIERTIKITIPVVEDHSYPIQNSHKSAEGANPVKNTGPKVSRNPNKRNYIAPTNEEIAISQKNNPNGFEHRPMINGNREVNFRKPREENNFVKDKAKSKFGSKSSGSFAERKYGDKPSYGNRSTGERSFVKDDRHRLEPTKKSFGERFDKETHSGRNYPDKFSPKNSNGERFAQRDDRPQRRDPNERKYSSNNSFSADNAKPLSSKVTSKFSSKKRSDFGARRPTQRGE
jgi:ATP-dependent RNA helicase RhlE